jgi:hypothetical protein
LTFTITPPGGSPTDYTQHLAYDGMFSQMTITQNFGRQGDTATFCLVDEYTTTPTITVIPVMSQVKLVDDHIGVTLFAGVINDPQLQIDGPTRNEWTLNCTDYTFYADNSTPVIGVFNNFNAQDIVVSLTNQAQCGISAATIPHGGFVAPGPSLTAVTIGYQSLSAAWKTLAQLAGQSTPYGWYVDENRALHFYNADTALDSGVTFTTHPTTGNSSTEGHVLLDSTNTYEWDGTTVHNRILVQGAAQLIFTSISQDPPTDVFRGDGVTVAWPLKFTFANVGGFKVNKRQLEINVVPAGSPNSAGSVPGAAWNIVQNNIGAYYLTANTAPSEGTLIQIWYSYNIPIVVQVNDRASQVTFNGPNGGIFGEFISDTTLTTTSMALARAQRERQEYAFPVERATFNTSEDWMGWVRAGYTFRYVNQFIPDVQNGNTIGIDDTFLCIQNRVSFDQGGYRTMQITAVRI